MPAFTPEELQRCLDDPRVDPRGPYAPQRDARRPPRRVPHRRGARLAAHARREPQAARRRSGASCARRRRATTARCARRPRSARRAGPRCSRRRRSSSGRRRPPRPSARPRELLKPRACYVCKAEFTRLHFFYDAMCGPCAELNYKKRFQTASLDGRVALITGARIKIGFQAALMMLRAGARVIVTTRFPRDAASRFAREADFGEVAGPARGARARSPPRAERRDVRALPHADEGPPRHPHQQRRADGAAARRLLRAHARARAAPVGQPPARAADACSAVTRRARRRCAVGASGHALRSGGRANGDATGFVGVARDGDGPGVGIRASAQLSQVPCAYDDATNDAEIFPVGPRRRRSPAGRPPRDEQLAPHAERRALAGDARGAARERGRAVHPVQQAQAADAAPPHRTRSTSSTCRRWRGSSRAARRRTSTRTRTWRRPRST